MIIQGIMDTSTDDNHDPNDRSILPNIFAKETFQVIITLNKYSLQILNIVHAL